MIEYVSGLLFSEDRRQVALVEKNRPVFLAGRLTAIGGRRETLDLTPAHGTSREVHEEAGILVPAHRWTKYAKVYNYVEPKEGALMECFFATTPDLHLAGTETDEAIHVLDVAEVMRMCLTEPGRVSKDLLALLGLAFRVWDGDKPAQLHYND